jgi:DNA-binding protein H-NS
MTSLMDIQSQIEKLQKQATDIRHKEFDKTVEEILAKMQAFGITVKDLQPRSGAKGRGKSKVKTQPGVKRSAGRPKKTGTSTVAAKYRGPNGETWSGRGLTPRWLSALISEGKTKEEFAVQS